ncbi:hypothetical protein Fmac_025016 [Flemingia macrophylla]|uniref:BPL/LPL catalytic domain-containing protein n=1 Tax=Flemingia macrophylla TaxID=520843 RepID=A0ABD1LR48_9FABA
MSEAFYSDCKRQTEVVFDYSGGDTVCSKCSLILESHSIDETSEWCIFANESGDNDPVCVGGPTNPLITDGGLSTTIAKPNGGSGEFLSSLGRLVEPRLQPRSRLHPRLQDHCHHVRQVPSLPSPGVPFQIPIFLSNPKWLIIFQEKLALERKIHRRCDTLLSLQHPPTYTVGKRQTVHNLLIPQPELEKIGAELHYTQRGGDITFHGPHQAILYPILSLRDMGLGARSFVEKIELTMIELTAMYGVKACPGQSGEPYEFYHCVLKSESFLEKLNVLEHTAPFFLPIREIENDLLSCNALAVLPTRISVLAWAMFNKNTTTTLSWKDYGLSGNHSSPSRLTYAEDALRSMSLPEGCVQLGEARTCEFGF